MPRSPNTTALYDRIINELKLNFGVEDLSFVKDTIAVIKYIEGLPKSFASKKLYYAVLTATLRDLPKGRTKLVRQAEDVYRVRMMEYNEKLNQVAEEQTLSEREKALWIEWPDVIKAWEKLKGEFEADPTNRKLHQEYAILSLYTLSPPLRADYTPIRITQQDDDLKDNKLVVDASGMVFVLHQYKTQAKYGVLRISAPPALEDVLHVWLAVETSGWLFSVGGKTDRGDPCSSSWLSKKVGDIMTRISGKRAGINILRHSYISWRRRDETPIKDSKALADSMAHSVGMSHLYRRI